MATTRPSLLSELRRQPFYRGQILSVREVPGRLAESSPVSSLFLDSSLVHLKNGSLPLLLQTLGYDLLYSGMKAGWNIAFPAGGALASDVVMKVPKSHHREIFWQVIALTEALDFSRGSLVLCHNSTHATAAHRQLYETIARADVSYAAGAALLLETADFDAYKTSFPLISVTTPEVLFELLMRPSTDGIRAGILQALSRIILPSVEEWPPPLSNTAAYLFRKLHLECLLCGASPTAIVTISPCPNAELFVQELFGRSIRQEDVVSSDGIETVPVTLACCSGAMVHDPNNTSKWVREPLVRFAAGNDEERAPRSTSSGGPSGGEYTCLLDFLAGRENVRGDLGCDLHYVLDVSGSMSEVLPSVVEAAIGDLSRKLNNGTIGGGVHARDHVRLTVFDETTEQVFSEDVGETLLESFEKAARAQTIRGGTDIPEALVSALRASLSTGRSVVELVLFSDGCSPVPPETKQALLRMLRDARSAGTEVGIVYVALDFDPPAETVNLIEHELGGVVLPVSPSGLAACKFDSGILEDESRGAYVVVLSGEKGLPASIIQRYHGGKRKLLFTRDLATLDVNPRLVDSVVVSGRFSSSSEIVDQVARMGRRRMPVFVLQDAEAWSRLVVESFREQDGLSHAPLIWTANPHGRDRMLMRLCGDEIDAFHYRYLLTGAPAYHQLEAYLDGALSQEEKEAVWKSFEGNPPLGGKLIRRNNRLLLRFQEKPDLDALLNLRTYTEDTIALAGQTVSTLRDRLLADLLYYDGASVDVGAAIVECGPIRGGQIVLNACGQDRIVPILTVAALAPIATPQPGPDLKMVERLGTLWRGTVQVDLRISGLRCYPLGDLDAEPGDDHYSAEKAVALETRALRWQIDGKGANGVASGLANMLKVAAVGLFRYADRTVFIHCEGDHTIWIVDLAPGGNGASDLLFETRALLPQLLRVGGRILLACPCEGGLRGATTEEDVRAVMADNGCPRCMRVSGTVVLPDSEKPSKRATLQWLLERSYLPSSATQHLGEKYDGGIDQAARIAGPGEGSRLGCLAWVRKIMSDCLGLDIPDSELAAFAWHKGEPSELGQYDAGRNLLTIQENLKEWWALDVLAHEFFHNLQRKVDGLFNFQELGRDAADKPPHEGLLLEEGAAVWAESHVVDALALRSCLELINLRDGDEYGDGFRLFKWIEENRGGVSAVLEFMCTGALEHRLAGGRESWRDLMRAAGLSV